MKICEIEGCNNTVFSKGRCKFHLIRHPIKSKRLIKRKVIKPKQGILENVATPNGEGVYNNIKMREFFLAIWKERPHYSEISGQFLGNEPKTLYFHHLLEKQKVKEAMYDKENIILLTADEHSTVHLDMYKYEEINKRRELLLIKYNKS